LFSSVILHRKILLSYSYFTWIFLAPLFIYSILLVVIEFNIRTFYSWVNPYSLKWHIDPEDRLVIPTHHNDWYVQLDDELPVPLNKAIFIKKGQWHRLIKGTGSLTIKVKKYG
jgi:hypothetical protein